MKKRNNFNQPKKMTKTKILIEKNIYIIKGDIAYMFVDNAVHGRITVLLDAEDVDKVKQYRWNLNWNAGRYIQHCYKKKTIYLHRLISGFKNINDHINRDTFDNRKCNIRSARTAKQAHLINSRNLGVKKNNKSGFRGITTKFTKHNVKKYVARGKAFKKTFKREYLSLEEALSALNNWRIKNAKGYISELQENQILKFI